MDSKNAIFSPTNADFDAFPPTVKRKYFSTLERLRYAQGQLPESAMIQSRPKTGAISKYNFVKPSRFQRSANRQQRDATPDLPLREVTEAESAWYQNLPEKIKRNHFTFEERHLYAAREEAHHVLDPTEELLYRLGGRQANRSLPSLSSNSDDEGDDSTFDEVIDTPLDAHDATFDHFQDIDSDTSDEMAHDYHTHIAQAANVARRPSTSASTEVPTQRKRSVTNFSSPRLRPSLDRGKSCGDLKASQQHSHPPRSSSIATASALNSTPSLYERRASRRIFSHGDDDIPPVPTIDPEAAHVSDPATRLKLKLYLGSAAKFDEALEFGFPAMTVQTPPASDMSFHRASMSSGSHSKRRSHSISTSKPQRESLKIGTTFFMDDDDDESIVVFSPTQVSNGLLTPTAESDIHTFYAELPADHAPPTDTYDPINTPHTAPAHLQHPIAIPLLKAPAEYHRPHQRSQSISLRPRQPPALDTTLAQQHSVRPLMSAREKPLKPWIEPTDSFGEREMTLRMTLTRKDLRADESLIYPENGAGSWSFGDQDVTTPRSGENKWRFWQRR